MRIGILSDIHESVANLRLALDLLAEARIDQIVILGDVFELGHRLDETVRLLDEAHAIGVWGNHDFGICNDPPLDLADRFHPRTLDFMRSLRPRLEIGDVLFTHVEPWLDTTKLEDLWWFEGFPETPERLAQSFDATGLRFLFVGHFHRWLLGTPAGLLDWQAREPLLLDPAARYLVGTHAVLEGHALVFDTDLCCLEPIQCRHLSLHPAPDPTP